MDGVISQAQAVATAEFGPGDQARFWRTARHGGLEGLTARFVHHRYARHSHDTFVMGTVVAGVEAFWCRGARHRAGAGEVCFVNPLEVHDGEPEGGFYAYTMIYPTAALVRDVAAELAGSAGRGTPSFSAPTVPDAELAARFVALNAALARGAEAGGDEALLTTFALALRRHARLTPTPPPSGERRAVALVRAMIEARFAEPLSLEDFADAAGLGRFRLLRAYKAATGTTPHAALVDRRVRAAAARLRRGEPAALVALATGFADQSHLSRAFRARLGVAPGRFARAGAGRG